MPPYTEDSEPHSRASGSAARTHSSSPAPGASSSAAGGSAQQQQQRPRSPEPDEDLDMTESATSMWLVRVPRYLRKGWQEVQEADKLLGTVRVYDPDHRGNQRMELILPDAPNLPIPLEDSKAALEAYKNIPRCYDLRIAPTESTTAGSAGPSRNTYAFKEWEESRSGDEGSEAEDEAEEEAREKKKRKRTALIGGVTNEVVAQPQVKLVPGERGGAPRVGVTDEYRALLRQRRLEASKPKHSVRLLDEKDVAINNRLAAGVSAAGFVKGTSTASFVPTKQKTTTEKFARLPRNELLDLLMEAFDRYPYWSIKGLRQHTQQPEAYLREVLSGIADLHKRGPYNGNWSLKKDYVDLRGPVATAAASGSGSGSGGAAGAGAGAGEQKEAGAEDDDDGEDFDEVI